MQGRYGAVLFVQVLGLYLAWQVYRLGRYAVRDQPAQAYHNAKTVLDLQGPLSIERHAQALVLQSDALATAVNHYYVYAHFTPVFACLVWLYIAHPASFPRMRTALVSATFAGLLVHGLFPLAPPRLMAELAMVDTLAVYGPRVYSADRWSGVTNQFAAMPSFHFGWALLVAVSIILVCRSRWRWLALAHPLVMLFAIMATANHYLLDAVVGGSLVVAAWHWAIPLEDAIRGGLGRWFAGLAVPDRQHQR
jgi:hypothetical protein